MSIPFKRADPTIDGIIVRLGGWKGEAVRIIREIIHEVAPAIVESVDGHVPIFELHGPICFIKEHPTHINLVFPVGAELHDPEDVLRHYGVDKHRHVMLRSLDDLNESAIAGLIREAVALNQRGSSTPSKGES